jgi:predicted Fe-S protein YdhL (DUF1289 family)
MIPSPCINVCVLDVRTQLCTGCFRHIDEIAIWGGLSDPQKVAVLEEIEQRRAQQSFGT